MKRTELVTYLTSFKLYTILLAVLSIIVMLYKQNTLQLAIEKSQILRPPLLKTAPLYQWCNHAHKPQR